MESTGGDVIVWPSHESQAKSGHMVFGESTWTEWKVSKMLKYTIVEVCEAVLRGLYVYNLF